MFKPVPIFNNVQVAGGGMSAADLRALREELVADDPAALNSNLRAGAVRPPSKLTAAGGLNSPKAQGMY